MRDGQTVEKPFKPCEYTLLVPFDFDLAAVALNFDIHNIVVVHTAVKLGDCCT